MRLFFRYQRTEDSYIYPYKLIRLTSKFIKFRVVKVCISLATDSMHQELAHISTCSCYTMSFFFLVLFCVVFR